MREKRKTQAEPVELSEEATEQVSGGPHFRTWHPPSYAGLGSERFLDHDFALNE